MKLEQANKAIWYGYTVNYSGVPYKLTAVIKRKHFKKSEWYYQAELQDMRAEHSVVIAPLEKIEYSENDG